MRREKKIVTIWRAHMNFFPLITQTLCHIFSSSFTPLPDPIFIFFFNLENPNPISLHGSLTSKTMPVIAAKRTLRSHPSSPPRKSPRRCTAATPNSTPTVIPRNPTSPATTLSSLSIPLIN